jgi:serine acetyltransferase
MRLMDFVYYLNSVPARFKGVQFSKGSRIGPSYDFRQVNMTNIQLMQDVQIGRRAWIQTISSDSGRIVVGKGTSIGRDCVISSAIGIEIGEYCVFSYRVSVIDHDHLFQIGHPPHPFLVENEDPISIGPRTFIGSNSTILKGAKIGSDCIIGASSVVVGDIPDRCVAAGVPARVVRCRS